MFASKDIFLKSSGGYQISRSVRLRSSASAYFNRTFTTPTNNKIWTYSTWFKRGQLTYGASGASGALLFAPSSGSTFAGIYFTPTDIINWYDANGGATVYILQTTQVFRDPSAWYHLVCTYDSTQATAANRQKMYVNGVQITSFSSATYVAQNTDGRFNSAVSHVLGQTTAALQYFDGEITEENFIDGQALTPTSFGEFNAITGVWQPKKYAGTYGTNGFYLNFSDNSAATAAAIGKDYSGNGNNWTPNNISITAGTTYDSMIDVPTLYADGGNGRGNYSVLNPVNVSGGGTTTITDGNLATSVGSTTTFGKVLGSVGMSTGKWYWEVLVTAVGGAGNIGIGDGTPPSGSFGLGGVAGEISYQSTGNKYTNNSSTAYGATYTTNDLIGVAYDADAGSITFYKNNASQGAITGFSGTKYAAVGSGGGTNPQYAINFGQRPFSYTPPTGYSALNTQNLPTPTISNGATVMAATLYTGTGASQSVSNSVNGISFQPDLVWRKARSAAESNILVDSVRGVSNGLVSNSTNAETSVNSVTAFNSDGFTGIGSSAVTYVAWQWNAGGSTVTNTSGSISAQVRANPTAGFSIVTYTGTGSAATIGHGLGVAPQMILIFERSPGGDDHIVYHASLPSNQYSIRLNTTAAQAGPSGAYWNSTSPTSSVFSVGTSGESNQSTATYVAYCFAPIAGYSAFGKYTGNGSADGPFVFLGFRPRYLLIKSSVVAGGTWVVFDSARSTYNVTGEKLAPNTADSENSGATGIAGGVDFLSNGFKIRLSWGDINTSNTLIYAAFAEVPFKVANAR